MAYAGFALTDFEGAEADELYFVAFNESLGYYVKDCFDSFSASFFVISASWATAVMSSVLFITKHPPLIIGG